MESSFKLNWGGGLFSVIRTGTLYQFCNLFFVNLFLSFPHIRPLSAILRNLPVFALTGGSYPQNTDDDPDREVHFAM